MQKLQDLVLNMVFNRVSFGYSTLLQPFVTGRKTTLATTSSSQRNKQTSTSALHLETCFRISYCHLKYYHGLDGN